MFFACVCLSVCLSVSKITQKRVYMDLDEMLRVGRMSGHGRTDQLLSPIRIIVWMPEPDCFLRYRIGYTELCSLAYRLPASSELRCYG